MSDEQWLDPYLKIREMTQVRNDTLEIADRYSKMARMARQQYMALKSRPKASKTTLDGLLQMSEFCDSRAKPLFDLVDKMNAEITDRMERLQNEAA